MRFNPGKLTGTADDPKKGMTFAELCQFCKEAFAGEVDPGTRVEVIATWGGKIKSLTVPLSTKPANDETIRKEPG